MPNCAAEALKPAGESPKFFDAPLGIADRWKALILAALVFACFPAGVCAQNVNYGDISVFLIQDHHEQFSHGYVEYRFRVTNNDKAKPHRVTLSLPGHVSGSSGSFQALRRSVDVGPNSSAIVALYQPTVPTIGPAALMVVEIDGRRQEDFFQLVNATGRRTIYAPTFSGGRMYSTFTPGSTGIAPLYLIGQKVPEPVLVALGFTPPAGGSSGFSIPATAAGSTVPTSGLPFMTKGGGAVSVLPAMPPMTVMPSGAGFVVGKSIRSPIGVAQWSDNWLGYTAYDLVFVTLDELKELENGGAETRSILTALWRYAESGGTLLVLGKGNFPFPKSWKKIAPKDVSYLSWEGLTWYESGFGNCFHVEETGLDKWVAPPKSVPRGKEKPPRLPADGTNGIYNLVKVSIQNSNDIWNRSHNTTHYQSEFPVVDNLSVPVRGLFVLMIMFAIVIGPVNFLLLSRWNKRIWLLWTVPVISFVFCLAILTYNLFAEGWFSKTRLAGITVLDQTEQRATSLGLIGFYCPLNPGSLRFSPLTELQIPQESHPVHSGSAVLDWTEDQNLARGWIMARVPTYFSMRKSEDRRERLTVREEAGGAVEAVNALGCDIRNLYLMTSSGKLVEASGIAAGASAKLTKSSREIGEGDFTLRKLFSSGVWLQGHRMIEGDLALKNLLKTLRPGTYLAIVETNPFLENGLKGAYERPSISGIFGILGDPEAKP